MKMVAGLGNPGREYADTPHNVGFDVADILADRLGGSWKNSSKFRALTAQAMIGGEKVLLVKAQTFMNLSGTSIGPLLKYFGMKPADLTLLLDDVNLPLGKLRVRGNGRSGGHNGLSSVIECVGTECFPRVRMGVGRRAFGSLADHVLGRFDARSLEVVRSMEKVAADAVQILIEKSLDEAMNRYNGWSAEEPRT